MTRTLLYYPTIAIKNQGWLRQSVLYWDRVGSIVPFELRNAIREQAELKILHESGIYQQFDPSSYVNQNEDLANEFIAFLKSKKERSVLSGSAEFNRFDVFYGKMSPKLVSFLVENKISPPPDEEGFLYLNRIDGLSYMAFLAKYLADESYGSSITPSTDYGLYRDLVFSPNSPRKGFPGLNFTLHNVLPVPLDDVPIEKILEFKKKRELELYQFREVIDQFESALKQVQEKGEIQHILQVFSERIKVNVELLDRLANDERMSTRLGTLENILNIENLETVLNLAEIVTNPISISTARKVVGGALSAGRYMLDKSNQNRANLSRSSYSFLYYAQQEGII